MGTPIHATLSIQEPHLLLPDDPLPLRGGRRQCEPSRSELLFHGSANEAICALSSLLPPIASRCVCGVAAAQPLPPPLPRLPLLPLPFELRLALLELLGELWREIALGRQICHFGGALARGWGDGVLRLGWEHLSRQARVNPQPRPISAYLHAATPRASEGQRH